MAFSNERRAAFRLIIHTKTGPYRLWEVVIFYPYAYQVGVVWTVHLATGSIDMLEAQDHLPKASILRFVHGKLDPCHCTSKDGSVRFSGISALRITMPDESFLTYPLASDTQVLKTVTCTDDAAYALVACFDLAIYLYLLCGFDKLFKTAAGDDSTKSGTPQGQLVLLFQVRLLRCIYIGLL